MIYFKQLKLADCLYPTLDIYYFGFLYLNSIAFLSTIKQSLNSQVADFKFFSFKAHIQKQVLKRKGEKCFIGQIVIKSHRIRSELSNPRDLLSWYTVQYSQCV